MKNKFNIGNQLKESLEKEVSKTRDRFTRADVYLNDGDKIKEVKLSKEKIVRDGFSMPESEWKVFEEIRFKVATPGSIPTKSELFRAMLRICSNMDKSELISSIKSLDSLKVGRQRPVK